MLGGQLPPEDGRQSNLVKGECGFGSDLELPGEPEMKGMLCVAGPQRRQGNQQEMLQGFISHPGLMGPLEVGQQINSGPNQTPPTSALGSNCSPFLGSPGTLLKSLPPSYALPSPPRHPFQFTSSSLEITPGTDSTGKGL